MLVRQNMGLRLRGGDGDRSVRVVFVVSKVRVRLRLFWTGLFLFPV